MHKSADHNITRNLWLCNVSTNIEVGKLSIQIHPENILKSYDPGKQIHQAKA